MLIVIVTHFRTRTARHKPIVVRYVSFSCIAARHMFLITFRWFCTPKHFIPNPPPGKHKKRNEMKAFRDARKNTWLIAKNTRHIF